MYNIVQNRRKYYLGSGIIIGISLLLIAYSLITTGQPFRLSIDFTGGVYWEFKLGQTAAPTDVRDLFDEFGLSDTSVTTIGTDTNEYQARLKAVDPDTKTAIENKLGETFGGIETIQYRNVGPAVGREVTRSALIAVLFVAMAIVIFLVIAFRNVSNPVRFGVTAVVAMVHDVIVACGFAALMGVIAGWEVDALFLTALLTVLGFSVQDIEALRKAKAI